MSTNAVNLTAPASDSHRSLINARTVAWALTALTAGSLVLGVAVVQIMGWDARTPPVEKEPPKASHQSNVGAQRKPIVLENEKMPEPSAPFGAPSFRTTTPTLTIGGGAGARDLR